MGGREAVRGEKLVVVVGGGWEGGQVEGAVGKRGGRAEMEGLEMVGDV